MMPRLLILVLVLASGAMATPVLREFQLPSGLKVVLSENHDRPLVRLEFRSRWSPAEEPQGKEGLRGFLAERLEAGGAGNLKRDAFQAFLAERALRLSMTLRPESFGWSVLASSQSQDAAFEGLAMAVTRPELDGVQIEAQRQRYIQRLKERTPRERAEDHFRLGIEDPSRSMLPWEGSMDGIETSDPAALFRRIVKPESSVLVIQGDMNLAQARQLTMLHLGAWGPRSQDPLLPAKAKTLAVIPKPRTWLIRSTSGDVEIQAGAPSAGLSIPIVELGAWLVNRALDRETARGLAEVTLKTFPNGAWLLIGRAAAGQSAMEAVVSMQSVLDRLSHMKIETPDLAAARLAWHSGRRGRALHPQQEAEDAAEAALAGVHPEEQVDSLQADSLQTAVQKWLSNPFYWVTGGLAEEAPLFEKAGLGPVEIIN